MFHSASEVVDITPRRSIIIGCGPPELIPPPPPGQALEANLIFLSDSNNGRLLVISVDALYVGPKLRKRLETELRDRLQPAEILIAATHSHNAPQLDDTKPRLGAPVPQHVEMVSQRILSAARRLLTQGGRQVQVQTRRYKAKSVVSRRRRRFAAPGAFQSNGLHLWQIQPMPNRRDVRATSEVLELVDELKQLTAVIWIMPCHPTSYPEPGEMSAHFIGRVREKIREENPGQNIAICFLQGASGDLRPPAYERPIVSVRNMFWRLVSGKQFGRFSRRKYDKWVDKMYVEYRFGERLSSWKINANLAPRLDSTYSKVPLRNLYSYDYEEERFASCQVIGIAGLKIVAVSAEPTWSVREELFGQAADITLVGCVDDTFGYFPTDGEFSAGGYEATGFQEAFSLRSNGAAPPLVFKNFVKEAVMETEEKASSSRKGK